MEVILRAKMATEEKLPRLRDFNGEKIDMACHKCERYGVYERKSLLKKFGASVQFVSLRRVLAIGCASAGTAKCEAHFPCLLSANLQSEPQ